MKKTKKFGLISGLLITGLLLAACGGGNSNANSDSGDGEGKSTKDSVSWMALLHTPAPPSGDIEEKLEDYTGIDIDFNWVPAASKDERLSAALASNQLADVVSLADMSNTTIRTAVLSGMFWDIEPYMKDYPNLANISEERLEASKVGGHVYGVPAQKPIARYGVIVRQDWLDNLGLEQPHTLEDLEKVAQAFTENDPDGNGQKDTVGIVDRAESFSLGFRTLAGYFGAGNWWDVEDDGTVTPAFMQDEYKDAMEWYRNIYENGWMNSDFAVMAKTDQQQYIAQGKAGIVITGLMDSRNYMNIAESTGQAEMSWSLINDMTYGKRNE